MKLSKWHTPSFIWLCIVGLVFCLVLFMLYNTEDIANNKNNNKEDVRLTTNAEGRYPLRIYDDYKCEVIFMIINEQTIPHIECNHNFTTVLMR